ncbi:uncharacterized protein V6R79_019380 [Siganus canaliculatus]
METSLKSSPHSVKRWQLRGTDYDPQRVRSLRCDARFSSWTPLNDKTSNLQLFEERMNLVLRWFDLWTDHQRKLLLHALLTRCSRSQLRCCRDLLMETVPVCQLDFTAVLPRFLSLYVMSFLSPRDLCSAAQVSWHWRVLAEQDCLWAPRCVRRGWFLQYAPAEKEFGAWKSHYVSCVSTLDMLSPREAAQRYGTLHQRHLRAPEEEEEEERRKERRMRQMIRGRLQEEKRLSLRTRKAWGSYTRPEGGSTRGPDSGRASSGLSLRSWPPSSAGSLSLEQGGTLTAASSLERVQISAPGCSESPSRPCRALSSYTFRPAPAHPLPDIHLPTPTLLLLISDRIPAHELLLSGVRAGVTAVLYDHRGTLSTLLTQTQRAVRGHRAQRLGLLAPGGTEEIHLLHGAVLSERTLLTPSHKGFWEELCSHLSPAEEGGGIDVFSPLAASEAGVALIQTLSALSGVNVRAPMGLATGSFQNILSEWSDGSVGTGLSDQQPGGPALQFVCEEVLQSWCTQAQWMEEALRDLRASLGPQLQRVSLQARARALGHFLWENIRLEELCVSKDLTEALTEGLTALSGQEESRPVEFLATFLTRWCEETERDRADPCRNVLKRSPSWKPELAQTLLDWRGAVAGELHHSECVYQSRLRAVLKVYAEPLEAALNSGRAILGYGDVHTVLTPVSSLLELSREFEVDLQTRLQQWEADQCVGDVFVKLCSKLRVYTNYLHSYTTAIHTIDKCRESRPLFRAFLRRTDRTAATHMLSLQELLLCPVWRIQEYVTLLQALCVHTPSGHRDHQHLASALGTLLRFRHFIQKLKQDSERERLMEETQQMIHGCPNLSEGNRHLIISQDAALLRSLDEQVPDSLRVYEQVSDVGLFLFNDTLVVTRRTVQHSPFSLRLQSSHTFLASLALSALSVREILHSRYVSHAFVLEGPRRSWVCATDRGEEKDYFLSALRSAVTSALSGDQ